MRDIVAAAKQEDHLARVSAAINSKLKRELIELANEVLNTRATEMQLTQRLANQKTWSARWWMLLNQLDIAHKKRLEMELLLEQWDEVTA